MTTECSPAAMALDAMHPAHFAGVPASLSQRALRSRLGRRHLFRMAVHANPRVFTAAREPWRAWAQAHPWLHWTQAQLAECARCLGAIALGPALKVILERDSVLFLRNAVGGDAWRIMQQADPWYGPAPDAVRRQGTAVVDRCGRDAAAVAAAVGERGAIELVAHAERSSALLAERLRLAYAAALPPACAEASWLPPAAVAPLVEQQVGRFAAQADTQDNQAGDGEAAA